MPSSWCAWSLRSHCWSACPPNSRVLDPSLRPELFLLQPFAEIAWFVLELLPPRILFGFTISSLYCPVSVVLFRKVKLQESNEVNQGVTPGDPIGIVGASAAGLFTALLFARAGRKVRLFERAERLDPALRTLIVTERIPHLRRIWAEKSAVNQIRRLSLSPHARPAPTPPPPLH